MNHIGSVIAVDKRWNALISSCLIRVAYSDTGADPVGRSGLFNDCPSPLWPSQDAFLSKYLQTGNLQHHLRES